MNHQKNKRKKHPGSAEMLFLFEPLVGFETNDPEITNHVLWPTELKRQVGKLTISRRYNQLPLLRSSPGGFEGSWPYRTYPGAKVGIFIKPAIGDRYFFACFTGKLLLFRYLKSKKMFFSDRIALLTLTGINSIPNNIICTFVRYLLIKMTESRSNLQKYAMHFGTYMGVYWILKFILFPLGLSIPFLLFLFSGLL